MSGDNDMKFIDSLGKTLECKINKVFIRELNIKKLNYLKSEYIIVPIDSCLSQEL